MFTPNKVNFTLYQGSTFYKLFTVPDDILSPDGFGDWTARMQVRSTAKAANTLLDLSTEDGGITLLSPSGGTRQVETYASGELTEMIPGGKNYYDILLIDAAGNRYRSTMGEVTVDEQITRPSEPVVEGTAASKTELDITGTIAAGTAFSVVASGVDYTKSGVNGNLGISSSIFNDTIRIQLDLNGVRFDKSDDVTWISSESFSLNSQIVNSGDKITIYS